MKEPHFKLKDDTSDKETSIRLYVFHGQFPHRRFVYGLKESILPELWDSETQRPTKNKTLIKEYSKHLPTIDNDLRKITGHIDKIKMAVTDYFELARIHQTAITPDSLKQHLDSLFNIKSQPIASGLNATPAKKETLNHYLDRYIKELEAGIRLIDGKQYVEGSIKNYKTFKSQFDLYQKAHGLVNFEDVTLDFYNAFVRFLNRKDYRINTIGKHISRLKAIMRAALNEGLHANTEFERKEFKIFQVPTDEIYLDDAEIQKIESVDLSDHPHLDLYRDIFLIGCYTAQRISDYNLISPHNIISLKSGAKAISLHQKKQKEKVIIPIKKKLAAILEKYEYQPPRVQDQKLNEHIKTICKIAKINTLIEIEEIIGGKKVKTVKPKYEMVSSHTARRTGATNMYIAGLDTISAMKITGHTKESTFLKYIYVSKEQNAEKLSQHVYFQ